jgi:dolichyl-phosphate beta-glucosyltransferase
MAINATQRHTAISIVIPAFNELGRLPSYLSQIHTYCQTTFDCGYEVIVVDDGSTDGLGDYLEALAADWDALSVIHHATNRGKGAAVRTGMLRGSGQLLLFADADGATPIHQEAGLREAIQRGADIAVGSRIALHGRAQCRRRRGRAVPAWVFRQLVRWYLAMPVGDTQCGFKMFRRDVGERLFSACDEDGYLVDLFVLRLAYRLGYSIEEVPVEWHDAAESKMRLVRDAYTMWRGLRRLDRRVTDAIRDMEPIPSPPGRGLG